WGGHGGRDQRRRMFERMCREGRDYRWSMETVVETDVGAGAEWTFAYTVSDAIPRSAGRPVRFRGMSVFEKRDGKIAAERESFDLGAALPQVSLSPEAMAKPIRRHRL